MSGPIYVAENRSGIKQVKLDIISSTQNTTLDTGNFASIQFLGRDLATAPRDVINDLQSAMGSFVLTAPRKAYIKISSEVIEEIGVDVGGTK